MPDLPGLAAATPGAGHPDSMRTLALPRCTLEPLLTTHGVHTAVAVLKAGNHRSAGLLRHLGFAPGLPPGAGLDAIHADEIACHRAGLAGLPDQR
jgi:hypothetical protein